MDFCNTAPLYQCAYHLNAFKHQRQRATVQNWPKQREQMGARAREPQLPDANAR